MSNMKYGEKEIINEITKYIESTYGQHYVSSNGVQVLDLVESIGDAVPFCRTNAIKYLSRFGKKNGKNRKDLFKAVHYVILMMCFLVREGERENELGSLGSDISDSMGRENNMSRIFEELDRRIKSHEAREDLPHKSPQIS